MLRHVFLGGLSVLLLSTSGSAPGAEAEEPASPARPSVIDPDGMMRIDGERTFVLGLYENPEEDEVLAEVAKAGFNLVRASAKTEALDRLRAHGLRAWLNTGSRIDLSQDANQRETQLREMAAAYGGHPALLVWEVPDEALWNCWYRPFTWRKFKEPEQLEERIDALSESELAAELTAKLEESEQLRDRGSFGESEAIANAIWTELGEEPKTGPAHDFSASAETAAMMCAGMRQGYALLRELDEPHPIWMNHAPRNPVPQLAAFNEAADIVGCDIYPVPRHLTGHSDIADHSLASVGAYTETMQAGAPDKPVWMVLQGFGWKDIDASKTVNGEEVMRRPNYDELRFMAFDTIVHGARGILYWGTAYIEKDSVLWKDLMTVVRELADLQPVLAAPDTELTLDFSYGPTMISLGFGVHALPKRVGDATWILVVNEEEWPVEYTIHGLESLEGTLYADEKADRSARVVDGSLSLTIRGEGVQVLAPVSE